MLLADAYLHNLDPFAIRFSGDFGVRWYGLAYAVGFLLAWWFARWMAKSGRSPLTVRDIGDMMFSVILGVLVGGRLGYAIFYERHLLTDFSSSFPFWSLFAINKGGMASHGGIIGVIVALTIYGKRRGLSVLHMLDVGPLASTIGLCLGRIANFINAELWGKALPASMQTDAPWWSVKYPMQIIERWAGVIQPNIGMSEKAYADLVAASASDFNISAPAPELTARVVEEAQRRIDALSQQLGPVIGMDDRFLERVVDIARDSSATTHLQVVQSLKPLLTAYYPSQLIQAFTDGPILAGVLALVWLRPRKPGVVGSWFLITYALLRVASEVFRQPDAGVGLTLGLSRGQLLSALMFVTGCVCLWIAMHRKVEKIGGLLKPMHVKA